MNEGTGKPNNDAPTAKAAVPTLSIDWELYGKYLDESDLSDADKQAFIETLWSIVVSFVDLGFGVHPVQQVMANPCEQHEEIRKFITDQPTSVVDSPNIHKTEFNASADGQSGPSQERSPK